MTEDIEGKLACSFCLKPSADDARLIAGPHVYICKECVDLCHGLLHYDEKPESRLFDLVRLKREIHQTVEVTHRLGTQGTIVECNSDGSFDVELRIEKRIGIGVVTVPGNDLAKVTEEEWLASYAADADKEE